MRPTWPRRPQINANARKIAINTSNRRSRSRVSPSSSPHRSINWTATACKAERDGRHGGGRRRPRARGGGNVGGVQRGGLRRAGGREGGRGGGVPRRVGGGVRRRRRRRGWVVQAGDARPRGDVPGRAGLLPWALPQRRRRGARHRWHRRRAAGRRQRVVDHVPLRPRPCHPRRDARRQRPRLLGLQGRRRPPLPARHHNAGHQPVEQRVREAGDAGGQQERARVHLRLRWRDAPGRQDHGAGGQPQHRRRPRRAVPRRRHPQRDGAHRRRLRLRGARHLRRGHPQHPVRAGTRDQHRQPRRARRRGGGPERDGGVRVPRRHAERPPDQDVGEALRRPRLRRQVLPRRHARRPEPHHRRPELLPRQRQLPRPELWGEDQRRGVRGNHGDVGDGGGGEVRLQREQPVHGDQAQEHQPDVRRRQGGAVLLQERRRVGVRRSQPGELLLTARRRRRRRR